jgi:hypothetical protein
MEIKLDRGAADCPPLPIQKNPIWGFISKLSVPWRSIAYHAI